ncbi:uncharacterized protein LOC132203439 [Neocloeon triangulifer]|uniref:uncharacterized protein LOC132203439 n=1 Tax=Neocloeon triangulifer TaxID=2078957 RepID=UPI00286F4589|nr:uncharacterized protein LOC132203439 [Neocloeon triangulifer]
MDAANGRTELGAEEKLLLIARTRWTRRVLEEQLLPALGGTAVPLFATAQFEGATIRLQTIDLKTQELTWQEVTCLTSARAVRFVQRLPRFGAVVDAVVAAELQRDASEELRVAHHVMSNIDLPTTSLEVAHRLAHVAPEIAAALGRGLRFESQLHHVATSISFAAKRTAMLMSHVGLAVGFTCLVLNSMALHQAIAHHDSIATATLASSVALDAASCGLFTAALIVLACKAAKLATILSTAALPASVAAFVVPPLVRYFWTKKMKSEAACLYLARALDTLEKAVILDAELNSLRFDTMVPISEINFRNATVTLGAVHIKANRIFLLNAPRPLEDKVDVIETLDGCEVQPFETSHLTMVLPTSGNICFDWSVHFLAKSFSLNPCAGLEKLSKLKDKGFNFHNGLFAVHGIKTSFSDSTIRIILDGCERTLAIAPRNWFPVQKVEKGNFDICFTFVGQGGKTTIQLEERDNGINVVRLESDSLEPSTWVLRFGKKLNLAYYSKEMFIFTSDGLNVVLTDSSKNLVYFVLNDVIYVFNPALRLFTPKVIMSNWVMENQDFLLEKLEFFDCAIEMEISSCVDSLGKSVTDAMVFYDPLTKTIRAGTSRGFYYTSSANFYKGALILELDGIDLSRTEQFLDINHLHKLAADKVPIYVSGMNLQGHFCPNTGILLLASTAQDGNLYMFSNTRAALVGVGNSFLEPREKLGEKLKSLSKSFFFDPVLALYPKKQRILAEYLLVSDMQNVWLLPFEQKMVSAVDISAPLELIDCSHGRAIVFDPESGRLYSTAMLPLDANLQNQPPPVEFSGIGRFKRVVRKKDRTILAFTEEGLVFQCIDAVRLDLLEVLLGAHSSLSQVHELVGLTNSKKNLVPVTDALTCKILFFFDTSEMTCLDAPENHKASECKYLGKESDNHFIFSSTKKKVLKLSNSSAPTDVLSCDYSERLENVLLLYEPEFPSDLEKLKPVLEIGGIHTVILATSRRVINLTYSLVKSKLTKFILDPLLKSVGVDIGLNFDTHVDFKNVVARDLVASYEGKSFVIHSGLRANFNIRYSN